MTLWEYFAAIHWWNKLNPPASPDGAASTDDGSEEPTPEEFAAMRASLRAAVPDYAG